MSRPKITQDHEMLKKIHLFQYVTPESICAYLEKSAEKTLKEGDVLLSPQKPNQNIYLLLAGMLHVHLDSLETQPLNVIKVGECVGEMSIIDCLEPSAYVIAVKDSLVLELNQQVLWTMVNSSHEIAKNLLYVLSTRVRHGHGVIRDSFEVQRELQHYAMVDGLTGLYNRRWFDEMFKRQFRRCQTDGEMLSLILLDIDHFKDFNDEFGHLVGDLVLKRVSEAMLNCLRSRDTLARFGGEEFVITLPDTDLPEAVDIAERIRITISKLEIEASGHSRLPRVTVSLGVGKLAVDDSESSLIDRADDALYRAKSRGRNRVESHQS